MSEPLESLQPIAETDHVRRRRLGLKEELLLAIAPTLVVLLVFALVEVLSHQRLLFASLASSAFLIYLDPRHGTNTVRTLFISQMTAATIGLLTYLIAGPTYFSGGLAMLLTIVLMIVGDVVHPPAVSTSLSFAFRPGNESNLLLFGLAVGITAILVLLQRAVLWLFTRLSRHGPH